jgi:hypothetical protein
MQPLITILQLFPAPSPVLSRFHGRGTRPERAAFQGEGWGVALSVAEAWGKDLSHILATRPHQLLT